MIDVKFPMEHASWDQYRAFYVRCERDGFSSGNRYGYGLLVMFDTLEVICTMPEPSPDYRHEYRSIGVDVTTSKDLDMWLPDGTRVAKAWLDDCGQQYLLHDHKTSHVVRLDGQPRYQGHDKSATRHSAFTPGIPHRFQYSCRAYIPGPGMAPISHNGIRVSQPYQKAGYTAEQMEHLHMIRATGQAAMKLTDHIATTIPANNGANPDIMLSCKVWTDMPAAQLPMLVHHGIGRKIVEHDYLLASEPA